MRLLVDTHVLLWAVGATRVLVGSVRRLLEDTKNDVFYSSISIFEIASKRALGRRSAPAISGERVVELANAAGLLELPVLAKHAALVESLAMAQPDPFDRLLLAQAQVEDMRLVTHDEDLARYDSRTILF
jgi:PIN domain nuclease of toxin-antitoxin system